MNKKVKVFNAGYGGYISTQELILLTRYANKLSPDLIVNINGANDIIHSLKKNVKPGTFFLNNTYDLYLTKPFLSPIFKVLQSSQLYNAFTRITERKRGSDYKISDYTKHLNIYIENIKSMSIFCDGLGVKYLNILQPHVIFKNMRHDNEKKFTLLNYRNEIVKKLYLEIKDKTSNNEILINNLFDSTNIFENNSEHIFSDDVHFMRDHNKGYYILAEFISNNLIN